MNVALFRMFMTFMTSTMFILERRVHPLFALI